MGSIEQRWCWIDCVLRQKQYCEEIGTPEESSNETLGKTVLRIQSLFLKITSEKIGATSMTHLPNLLLKVAGG